MPPRDEIDQVREEVAMGNRILTELGLATGVRASLGHVSMRLPSDPNKFLVKGRGYRIDVLSRMRPEDMVLCDLEGFWLDGPVGSLPCNEVKIHSCIYKNRPDVLSVTHVHPEYAVLLSVLGKQIVPMAQEGVAVARQQLNVYPKTKIITSEAEGQEVAKLLANNRAVLLFGHGAVTVGASIEESVMNMAHLEHQARYNYRALCAMGKDHPRIPDDLAEAVGQARPLEEPHFKPRVEALGNRRSRAGIWPYYQELVSGNM
jgi:ribulose-5-phosphate 4-epimerase/fuculose-1-phosphate aldolase